MLQLRADTTGINSSHIIHRVSFGPMYPGQVNPLNGGAPVPPFMHDLLCLDSITISHCMLVGCTTILGVRNIVNLQDLEG